MMATIDLLRSIGAKRSDEFGGVHYSAEFREAWASDGKLLVALSGSPDGAARLGFDAPDPGYASIRCDIALARLLPINPKALIGKFPSADVPATLRAASQHGANAGIEITVKRYTTPLPHAKARSGVPLVTKFLPGATIIETAAEADADQVVPILEAFAEHPHVYAGVGLSTHHAFALIYVGAWQTQPEFDGLATKTRPLAHAIFPGFANV
jgi:hypothetical protein